jgi:serpin B
MCKFKIVFTAVLLYLVAPLINASAGLTITAEANNKFAFDLYAALSNTETGKNVFVSPYSISSALAMTYEGARQATASQIAKVFYYPADIAVLRQGYTDMSAAFARKNKGYVLSAANSLWPQKDYIFSKDYLTSIEKYYKGKAKNVDYISDRDVAVALINSWTAKQTNDKIKDILHKDSVNELTRLVLVNAIYFKGTWQTEFKPSMTKKADFNVSAAVKKPVDMMNLEDKFGYAELDGTKVLELPYAGKDICMLLVLPAGPELSSVEKSMSYEVFRKWIAALSEIKVNVHIPKFTTRCRYSLMQPLIDMGMPDAFDELKADFSGMTGKKDLYIGAVIHSTFVEVNEKGTEAAAATAVIMMTKSIEETADFRADHPFIYFIYDKTNKNILFMGRMSDPSAESN